MKGMTMQMTDGTLPKRWAGYPLLTMGLAVTRAIAIQWVGMLAVVN